MIWYVIGGFAFLWLFVGYVISIYQLKTKRGVGRWACTIWGCSYGMRPPTHCPNCGREFPPV